MPRKLLVTSSLALLLLCSAAWAQSSSDSQVRSLQGQVVNDAEAPLAQAIVYLKNTKTLAVKSYITQKDGMYHFNALSSNVDYEIHAEFQGKKSGTKTLSSFDSRRNPTINLKIK
ncbi:MAG: carboxypeptidase-like regulatory domain-containing protein [Terriglobales bacterium]